MPWGVKNKDHHVVYRGQGSYLNCENQYGTMDIIRILRLDTWEFEFQIWHLLVVWKKKNPTLLF